MAWNAVLLGTAVLICVQQIGLEFSSPPIQGSNVAQTLAPRLGVPEARLREVLTEELSKNLPTRIVVGPAGIVGFLTALLAVRLILDWRVIRGRLPIFREREMEGSSMNWNVVPLNVVLLGTAVLVLVLNTAFEFTSAVNYGSDLPEILAPQLGVPEARLREALTEELLRGVKWRMTVRGAPVGFLTALLALRLVLDWRAARKIGTLPIPFGTAFAPLMDAHIDCRCFCGPPSLPTGLGKSHVPRSARNPRG